MKSSLDFKNYASANGLMFTTSTIIIPFGLVLPFSILDLAILENTLLQSLNQLLRCQLNRSLGLHIHSPSSNYRDSIYSGVPKVNPFSYYFVRKKSLIESMT